MPFSGCHYPFSGQVYLCQGHGIPDKIMSLTVFDFISIFIDTGANASAEEAEEALEDTAVKVNNVVHSFRLQSTSFDRKSYLTYLKGKRA